MISSNNSANNFRAIAFFCAAVILCGSMAACSGSASSGGQERRFDMKGKVVSVDKRSREATIAHEEIPGFMDAMTMPFNVKDEWVLEAMSAGDSVQATLVVDRDRAWLENPVITKGGGAGSEAMKDAGGVEPKIGDEPPDFKLVNQDGKRISLRQYRERALLVTFIYTRCPLPEYCPLLSSKFAEIHAELEKSDELRGRAHLLSVTLDPAYDTPKVLRSYGAAYTEKFDKENFAHWEFATGDPEEIKRLAQFFGLNYLKENDQIIHSLRTALIAPDGRLFKVYPKNDWKPLDVVRDLEVVLKAKN